MLATYQRYLTACIVLMVTATVVALQGGTTAATKPTSPAITPPAATAPAAAQGIPVPDGPVVKKTELEGGLVLEDIRIGDGYEVKAGAAVVAHYHGTLKEGGKVFDSSFQRGTAAAFPLAGVIAGWQQGVPGMKIGGVRRLHIPSKLGYGERGAGANIPPNSDLVFVIQLVDALQFEDIKVGTGEGATAQFVAVTAHVIKDKDGKVVETVTSSMPYVWIPGEFQGMQFGLEGMKVGGKRTIKVPKEMNTPTPGPPAASRPTDAALTIEVELIALRNLTNTRRR